MCASSHARKRGVSRIGGRSTLRFYVQPARIRLGPKGPIPPPSLLWCVGTSETEVSGSQARSGGRERLAHCGSGRAPIRLGSCHPCARKHTKGERSPRGSQPRLTAFETAASMLAIARRRAHDPQRRLISKSNRRSIFGSTDLLDRCTRSIPRSIPVVASAENPCVETVTTTKRVTAALQRSERRARPPSRRGSRPHRWRRPPHRAGRRPCPKPPRARSRAMA